MQEYTRTKETEGELSMSDHMNKSERREAWVGKHSLQLKTFSVYCGECEQSYSMSAQVRPAEIWCPFCHNDSALKPVEVPDDE